MNHHIMFIRGNFSFFLMNHYVNNCIRSRQLLLTNSLEIKSLTKKYFSTPNYVIIHFSSRKADLIHPRIVSAWSNGPVYRYSFNHPTMLYNSLFMIDAFVSKVYEILTCWSYFSSFNRSQILRTVEPVTPFISKNGLLFSGLSINRLKY